MCSKITVESYLRGTHSWTPWAAWKDWRCFSCAVPLLSFFLQALAAFLKRLAGGLRECTPSTLSLVAASSSFGWMFACYRLACSAGEATSMAMALGEFPVQKLAGDPGFIHADDVSCLAQLGFQDHWCWHSTWQIATQNILELSIDFREISFVVCIVRHWNKNCHCSQYCVHAATSRNYNMLQCVAMVHSRLYTTRGRQSNVQ